MLIVTKLDCLGRNAIDVQRTVYKLGAIGVRIHCLALGRVDLTSSVGKMTMQVLYAVAEFERALLTERTQAGLTRVGQDNGPTIRLDSRAAGRSSSEDHRRRAPLTARPRLKYDHHRHHAPARQSRRTKGLA